MRTEGTTARRNISFIPAKQEFSRDSHNPIKKIRVAAYCRVSTLQEQQETSYEAQFAYYTKLINDNPNWVKEGIFAE